MKELEQLTDEELALFSDVTYVITYLVEKFLLIDNRLIYKYDVNQDKFSYHEEEQGKLVKKFETYPNRFMTTYLHILKKLRM